MITKENYEAFILDYYEGNLAPGQVGELMIFLEQHPHLKEEFEEFENISLEADNKISYANKAALKKENPDFHLTEADFIGYIENQLGPKEKIRVEEAVKKNSSYEKDLLLYKKTLLEPEQIIFEEKNGLKRKQQKVIPLYYYTAIAASLALLFVTLFWLKRSGDTSMGLSQQELATIKETITNDTGKLSESHTGDKLPLIKEENKIQKKNTLAVIEKPIKRADVSVNTNRPQLAIVEFLPPKEGKLEPLAVLETDLRVFKEIRKHQSPITVASSQDKYLTLSQLIKKKIDPSNSINTINESEKEKLTKWDGFTFAAKLFQKATGVKTEVKAEVDDEGKATRYTIALGGVEFSRSGTK